MERGGGGYGHCHGDVDEIVWNNSLLEDMDNVHWTWWRWLIIYKLKLTISLDDDDDGDDIDYLHAEADHIVLLCWTAQ